MEKRTTPTPLSASPTWEGLHEWVGGSRRVRRAWRRVG
jgi:hypothetical protein